MMTTNLVIFKDRGGTDAYALNPSDETYNVLLAADTLVSVAVPSSSRVAYFFVTSGQDFYASVDATIASLPSSATLVNDGLMLNHNAATVDGATTIYFRSVNAVRLSVVFYK